MKRKRKSNILGKMKSKKRVFIKKVRLKARSHLGRKGKKKVKNRGTILLPGEMIGKLCIVYPITKSQRSFFREKTKGYKKAERFIKTLLKNPRIILDEIE